jgi:hypothetical protein
MRLARPFKSARSSHASLTAETDTHAPYYYRGVCVCVSGLARLEEKQPDQATGRPRHDFAA